MKKSIYFLVIIVIMLSLSACGNNGPNGKYYAYWTDEQNEPWKYELNFKGNKMTYKVINKMKTDVQTLNGTVNKKDNEIIYDANQSDKIDKYSFADDVLTIKHSNGEKSKYYKEGSDKQKEFDKKFENDAQIKRSELEKQNELNDKKRIEKEKAVEDEEKMQSDSKKVSINDLFKSKDKRVVYLMGNPEQTFSLNEYLSEAKSERETNKDIIYAPFKKAILIKDGKAVLLNYNFEGSKYDLTDFLDYTISEQFDKLLKIEKSFTYNDQNIDLSTALFNSAPVINKFKDGSEFVGASILFPEFYEGEEKNVSNPDTVNAFNNDSKSKFLPEYTESIDVEKYNELYVSALYEERIDPEDFMLSPLLLFVSDKNEQIDFGNIEDAENVFDKSESEKALQEEKDKETDVDNL